MRARAAIVVAAALLALASGCAGAPDRATGTVRYRDPKNAAGTKGGTVVSVATGEVKRGNVSVSEEDMAGLLAALDEIGLFDLGGRPSAPPSELPPGSIGVDTSVRKFFVTLQDLKTKDDSACFARSAYRIVAATQGGPHYSLPK